MSTELGKYARYLEYQLKYAREVFPQAYIGTRLMSMMSGYLEKLAQVSTWRAAFSQRNFYRSAGWALAEKMTKAGPKGDISELLKEINTQQDLLDNLLVAGYTGFLGSAWASYAETYMVTGQLQYIYKTMMYHTAITPRMKRYYNYMYHPNYPNMDLAWRAYVRGEWTRPKVIEAGQMDGWSKAHAELLMTLFEKLPTPHEAFYLHRKDLIKKAERNALYKAGGYDKKWFDIITGNWEYTPTLYDIARLADSVELDTIWATQVMRKRGLSDRDIAKILPYLQLRPLRDEIRALTTHGIYMREHGYWGHDGLHDYFVDLGLQTKEIELLDDLGDARFERELLEERIEILTWDFRMAKITQADFLAGLLGQGIDEEKANLMVETEIAKGYFGYY